MKVMAEIYKESLPGGGDKTFIMLEIFDNRQKVFGYKKFIRTDMSALDFKSMFRLLAEEAMVELEVGALKQREANKKE